MANSLCDELWAKCQDQLELLVQDDTDWTQRSRSSTEGGGGGAGKRERASEVRGRLAGLYARYVDCANRLEDCHDQCLQPQKRELLRRLLDGCLGRVIELKHELVEVELSEHAWARDQALLSGRLEEEDPTTRLTPEQVESRIPRYFRRERAREIAERRQLIERTLRALGHLEDRTEKRIMTERAAVRLIQAHERARQGRVRFQFMKEILDMKERSSIRAAEAKDARDPLVAERSALLIQRVWRGWRARARVRQRKLDEMSLIGMLPPAQQLTETARKLERITRDRYELQDSYQAEYEQLRVEVKRRIKAERSAIMEERMRAEIRAWIGAHYRQTGKIPDIPSAENGGSRLIFSRQDTESSLSKSTGVSSSKDGGGAGGSKKSRKSAGKAGGNADADQQQAQAESEAESEMGYFRPQPSNHLAELARASQEYREIWRGKDESANTAQSAYLDMIAAAAEREVEREVRLEVDQALRADVEALQAALDRDRGYKGKRGAAAKKSQKRARRSGKKNKRKKEKDLTPDRTTESLLEELLEQGIVRTYPEIELDSYQGQCSYGEFHLGQRGKDPLPAIGDIRQLIREYCILPLGSELVRETTPLVRSVLLAGPRGSGKRMLVNAVCHELGATLFDLTPANLAGKYPGKSGLVMLLHLISKVSRLLQPSVIFMEGAEKPFVKKVPKTDRTDPKRLKKDLAKLVKGIGPEDRVIVIGTSRSPWEADQKLMYQAYDKVIYVPRPDYGSMSRVWKGLLYRYSGLSREFDTSAMARLCDGFTIGTVVEAINEVMTTKRMVQLKVRPLTHIELINALSTREPVYKEEEDTFLNWYSKTPTCRKKQRSIELELAREEEANEKRKKKGSKK
ncbi:IQ and AAA domain-containing protein 1 [Trichogramma pretiosum]|uniref:IQ and AAA domain-containing protein 1 n=1 Tax=Trichogramma pretiosum TaxID=7493 RepID=UPI0006C9A938|nr:IQ and AAA domain-containing protein 1 [Trichogramma pretiosum]